MRRLIAFACEGDTLVGTLDAAPGTTGVVVVSGGNETRYGPHRGMAMLAAGLAARGLPVFRYDRRGVGDSEGVNLGWESAGPDLIAAVAAFRNAQPQVARIVGYGNCDAATTLALFGSAAGIDRVVFANPWLVEEADALPPAAAIRSRYAERLRDPRQWLRLLRGGVDLRKLIGGLGKLLDRAPPDPLAARVLAAIGARGSAAAILLAKGDATAIAFADAAKGRSLPITTIASGSHSFVGHADAIEAAIVRLAQA